MVFLQLVRVECVRCPKACAVGIFHRRIIALEKQLKVTKHETEEANILSQANQALKSATHAINDELKVATLELKEVRESEAEYKRQVETLRLNVEQLKSDQIKQDGLKYEEIKRLILKKNNLENGVHLQKNDEKLKTEMKKLKEKNKVSGCEKSLPFPCDKCNLTFKTAGILIKHVKSHHDLLPTKVLPYPCDKCELSYKTPGLLICHVMNDHTNLPNHRP